MDEEDFDRVLERPRRRSRERPRLLSPVAGVAGGSTWRNVQLVAQAVQIVPYTA